MPDRKAEKRYPLPSMPLVSQQTIGEWGSSPYFNEGFMKRAALYDRNNFVTITNWAMGLDPNRHICIQAGAMTTYLLLAVEAEKQGALLPQVVRKDIDNYFKSHPLRFLRDSLVERGINPTHEELKANVGRVEYGLPNFDKYKDENPFLLEFLEKMTTLLYNQYLVQGDLINAKRSPGYASGAFLLYELLKNKADRERFRKLTK